MTEPEKAKAWRERNGWTFAQLAELTGYSATSIVFFERGVTPAGSRTDPFAWHRYRMICSAIEHKLKFDW